MECDDVVSAAVERLGGEMIPARADGIDEHLSVCEECRERVAEMENAWTALGTDPDAGVRPEFRQETLEMLRAETLRRKVVVHPRSRWMIPMQIAALLAVGVGGFFLARTTRPNHPAAAAENSAYNRGVPARSGRAGSKLADVALTSSPAAAPTIPASPQIVASLIATLRTDKSPGVRKKAAEALAGLPPTPQIRDAFLAALKSDANPAIRIAAVDALAKEATALRDPRAIETLREKATDNNESGYVRIQAASLLKKIEL